MVEWLGKEGWKRRQRLDSGSTGRTWRIKEMTNASGFGVPV